MVWEFGVRVLVCGDNNVYYKLYEINSIYCMSDFITRYNGRVCFDCRKIFVFWFAVIIMSIINGMKYIPYE